MQTGIIYKVVSPSGRIYIGQTIKSLTKRKTGHRNDAFDKNRNYNTKFSRAIRKYGDKLKWEILYDNIPWRYLNNMEIITIGWYNSYKSGYNSTLGGEGNVGFRHTDETKQKMSEANKGKKLSKEHKKKLSQAGKGRKFPKEHIEKISGERNAAAKLTWEKVREIRAKHVPHEYSLSKLAKEYSVGIRTIHKIIRNET